MQKALVLMALVLAAAAAHGDETLRCGSKIVRLGMSIEEVRGYCGEPSSARVEEQDVRAGGRLVGKTEIHIWRYDRAAGQMPADLVFDQDKLKSITYVTM
ncbi:MAG: DUF2845 domain-containing protein [Gammaproteobacteria bacterium]|nr:DUF2845 domain-containing protein [Gammaproteobacteria bacterium]MDH4254512.1 DUF2845 domain-containing protein [Gammaproteobacteria bacterium]MDH5309590.1 DUF2845 domain-containing protein [Gammaproteobacteria bacterium]